MPQIVRHLPTMGEFHRRADSAKALILVEGRRHVSSDTAPNGTIAAASVRTW
jgi:hypothetical protein